MNIVKPNSADLVGRVRNPRSYSCGNYDNRTSIGRRGNGRTAGRATGGDYSGDETFCVIRASKSIRDSVCMS